MKTRIYSLVCICVMCSRITCAQDIEETCISEEELFLASEINDYRTRNGSKALPLSISLTYVAKAHVFDLENNHPDTSFCSTASWSDNGNWSACCFNPKKPDNYGMWNKPKEITKYKYRGYELSYYQDEVINVNDVAYIWKTTPAASDMLLCKGKYKNHTWKAMGIGIDDHYVCVWFGQSKDIYGEPKSCKDGYSGSLVLNDIKKIHKDPNVVKEDKTKQNIRTTPQITDNQITATGKIKSTTESSINKNQTRFHIIVGSFGSLKNAEIGKKQIENKNNSCKVIVIKAENRYRLSLENYATKEEANARKVKLAADFPGCWVFEK